MEKKKNGVGLNLDKKKIIRFLKRNYIPICVALAVLVVGITVLAVVLSGDDNSVDESESEKNLWGSGITENIPEFSEKYKDIDLGDSYVAAYYENVVSEKVSEYVSLLENELGISFSKSKYPYVAAYGDKIITLHYNVTEMRFSVTVTEKMT